jgi:hypothetical protein
VENWKQIPDEGLPGMDSGVKNYGPPERGLVNAFIIGSTHNRNCVAKSDFKCENQLIKQPINSELSGDYSKIYSSSFLIKEYSSKKCHLTASQIF